MPKNSLQLPKNPQQLMPRMEETLNPKITQLADYVRGHIVTLIRGSYLAEDVTDALWLDGDGKASIDFEGSPERATKAVFTVEVNFHYDDYEKVVTDILVEASQSEETGDTDG